jgi:CRISPR-associated protein Cas1
LPKKTIYVFSSGELKRKQNTIYFEKPDGTKKFVPVENTGEILIFGEVSINKKLLEFLSQKEILLHFFNHYGYYSGTFYPREHYNSGFMILKQSEHYLDEEKRLNLVKRFVRGASANITKVLEYYNRRGGNLLQYLAKIQELSEKIEEQKDVNSLMAIEGNMRSVYYDSWKEIIKNKDFEMGKRERRPPKNMINALVSFGNSLVYIEVLRQIYQTHLDPRIGYLHSTNFRRFSLNLDVSEIFKPIIVDRIIFSLLNKKMLSKKHFAKELNGTYLNDKGRMIFVKEFDSRLLQTIKYPQIGDVSYKRLIRLELYKIEKHLMGEKEYTPFVARW